MRTSAEEPLDWTPDGICLSKLESPTDEPLKSVEMDARSAQLFRLPFRGQPTPQCGLQMSVPSSVSTHGSCFVCLVADLAWTTANKAAMEGARRRAMRC